VDFAILRILGSRNVLKFPHFLNWHNSC